MAKKRNDRSKRKASQKPVQALSHTLLAGLVEAEQLSDKKRYKEAQEKLRALDRRYPNRPEILTGLLNVCYDLGNMPGYLYYAQRLFKLSPNDPDFMLGLAGAYMVNIYPARALQLYYQFLKRYPEHDQVKKAHEAVALLEAEKEHLLAGLPTGLPEEEGLALGAQQDEVRYFLESSQFPLARQAAKRLLERYPDSIPVLNNLSQVDFLEGNTAQAITAARRVLELDPPNFQALGNLSRYLFLTGQTEEARRCAEQLKRLESDNKDIWLKKMETLSYLGDDQGVLAAFHEAERSNFLETNPGAPLLYHLAAVAARRLNDEKSARRYWQKSLKLNPNFELARDNLADLDQPLGKQNGPWPFPLGQWLPFGAVEDFARQLQPALQRGTDTAFERAVRRYLKSKPEIITRIRFLFEWGEPIACQMALNIAKNTADLPELAAALRDFALGQHGADELRYQAAQAAQEAGLLPAGPVRLWLQGKWQEIVFMGFEIYEEPEGQYSAEVTGWMTEAAEALYEGDAAESERLLKQALAAEPDSPHILNNLGAAYAHQGRRAEAEAIVEQLYREHPDYFFSIVGMANLHLSRGETEQAKALLQPLLSRGRLHISEFRALAVANIQLALAEGAKEAAQNWLDIWSQIDPDNPDLNYWQGRATAGKLSLPKLPNNLRKLLKW